MATETQTAPAAHPPAKETFHMINDPADVIHEALTGLTIQNPSLIYEAKHKIIYRRDLEEVREKHVTTIGFAGGGHEPMFTGFVGPTFLSCAVSGNIFASPTAAQIYAAIRLCQPTPGKSPGTLIVCGNYTGDILNAGLALTRAQAAGYKVRFVPVGDDVAVGRAKGGKVGRRGLSGHLVALKAACALAEKGEGLERVTEVVEWVARNVGTVGVAFDRVSLPTGTLAPLPLLPPNTIELGMGAHGEPGLSQLSPPPSPAALVSRMLDLLTDITDADRAFIPFTRSRYPTPSSSNPTSTTAPPPESSASLDNEVILLLNSLGATSDAVLASFAELAIAELERRGFVVRRLTLGPLVTSLKMSGFGITIWRLPTAKGEVLGREEALELWDREVGCGAWRQ